MTTMAPPMSAPAREVPTQGAPLRDVPPIEVAAYQLCAAGVPAPEKRTRQDALPENSDYRDEGCDLFPSCQTGPLPRCRYDEPGGARTMINKVRDEEIRRLRFDAGMPVDDISMQFRVSRRTVFRVLRAAAVSGRSAR
jgi:hypothetical protein